MTPGQLDRFSEWLRQEEEHERGEAAKYDGTEAGANYAEGRADAFRSALIALGVAGVGALYLRSEPTPPSRGEQLDAISRDLDRTTAAWAAAGHPFDGPEVEEREAVFRRLREWNAAGG